MYFSGNRFINRTNILHYRSIRLFLQATGLDQAAGYSMVGLAGMIFTYYTLWVVVLVSYILM